MIGSIAGDVIGSVYEGSGMKEVMFPLFTPWSGFTADAVLTVATAWAILKKRPYGMAYHRFGRRYPDVGYGPLFALYLQETRPRPYNSYGNGAAMRVAPIGFAFSTLEEVLLEAERSALVTHDHPEGVKGAQAVALAVFLARSGASKGNIRAELMRRFPSYDLLRTVDEIRPVYQFDGTCQGSVPEAIIAFLDSTDYEDAVRLAVSLGGDADTQAAIAGGIAHAFYRHVPAAIDVAVRNRLPSKFVKVIDRFQDRFSETWWPDR